MSCLRPSLNIALIFSLIFSPLAQAAGTAQEANAIAVTQDLKGFVNKYKNTKYAYTLNADEFSAALAESGLGEAYDAQMRHAIEKADGAKDSLARLQELKADEEMEAEAFLIVDKMFKQNNIVQMNLDLLAIMHEYIFDSSARGPLSHIVGAIEQYNFSPEQLHEMKKQAKPLKQATSGALAAFGAVTVGALLLALRRHLPVTSIKNLQGVKSEIESATAIGSKSTITKETSIAAKNADSEIEQMLREMQQLRGGDALVPRGIPNLLNVSSNISKRKFFANLSNFSKKQTFRNFALITGASVVGGSANIGFNALNRIFFDEDITNTYINPADLKSDIYDGLAVLNLSCRSYDLLERASGRAQSPNHAPSKTIMLQELNSLYAEYTLMKKLSPRYLEKTYLPENITADPDQGTVTLRLNLKGYEKATGHENIETVRCEMLKGSTERVQVSLAESLSLITQTYLAISGQSEP